MTDRPSYLVVLRPEARADDPGGLRRLRNLLKSLLRRHGFRCVELRPAEARETDRPAEREEGRG